MKDCAGRYGRRGSCFRKVFIEKDLEAVMAKTKSGGRKLVIVESPAKAKTINKYLGDDFVVKASMGHVRDLPQRDFGINITEGFIPTYAILPSRLKVITELRKLASAADEVYLATDRDREGEAIAWHLVEALNLPEEKIRRVIFNEITRTAIAAAFDHPHQLELDRVNAQQARRILDRIVGYELSPLLWRKIAKGLSAGRVQSVAVRLIVEREREIRAFVPEESWQIVADFSADAAAAARLAPEWLAYIAKSPTQKEQLEWLREHGSFRTELAEVNGAKFAAKDSVAARAALEALGWKIEREARRPFEEYRRLNLEQVELHVAPIPGREPNCRIADLATKRTTTRPSAPFTTAALQQQASTQLRFSASRTMRVAQGLYEGVDLSGEGPIGLITYMRTDSTNLSNEAIDSARRFIRGEYGDAYLPDAPNFYGKRQARAQEAHEAIRPTDPFRTPDSLRKMLTDEQLRLYDLIWRRFIACQMPPAQWDSTSVTVEAAATGGASRNVAKFTGSGRKLVFDGFMRVAGVTSDDALLPPLETGKPVGLLALVPRQQHTSPPSRYTEASLVKTLESEGIGRPSTYASIIDTITDRGYVELEERKFFPTALGELVTEKLVAHFPQIMDVKFTSFMEDELDKIEEAHLDWVQVLHEFYDPFHELLTRAATEMDTARAEPSDVKCPLCNAEMVYRWSKTGRFLACTAYPACKSTLNVDRDGTPVIPKVSEHACAACGKPMVVRRSKSGVFLGCTGYPDCRTTVECTEQGEPKRLVTEEELKRPCEACGEGTLVVKRKGRRAFLGCDRFPACKQIENLPDDVRLERKPTPPPEQAGINCDKCRRPMVLRSGKRGKFIACSGFPKCRNAKPIEKLEELRALAAAAGAAAGASAGANGDAAGDALHEGESAAVGSASGRASRRTAAGKSASRGGAASASGAGEPPPGFAMTRTGRPVVEVMPEEGALACPECGEPMDLKRGRFGPFFSCTGFPRCKFVANLRGDAKKRAEELMPAPDRPKPEPSGVPCDECGKEMLIRAGRRGKFLGCSGYPKCKATREMPAEVGANRG
ncbi:MAG: type I DNA topoisomerase [Planctomycetia bacterium]|nr:MAG: type I DNA topoisomerase [Planctomycetia bacterium]